MASPDESSSQGLGAKVAEARHWIATHKLQSVGALWASGIIGSIAYNFRKPGERMSVKIIHARLHAQALTLAALLASAGVEYFEHHSGDKVKRYEEHVQ